MSKNNKRVITSDNEEELIKAPILGKRDSKGNSIDKNLNVIDQLPPVNKVIE